MNPRVNQCRYSKSQRVAKRTAALCSIMWGVVCPLLGENRSHSSPTSPRAVAPEAAELARQFEDLGRLAPPVSPTFEDALREVAVRAIFRAWDTDHSGAIDKQEEFAPNFAKVVEQPS